MRTIIALTMILGAATVILATENPYEEISIEEIHARMTTRNKDDRTYSGQIKSEEGAKKFLSKYSLEAEIDGIDWDKTMLIFGITDNISTSAFQFLKDTDSDSYCLDYYETGIRRKLPPTKEGDKYSFFQIFSVDRIEGISHIRVKNIVTGGLSEVYD